MEEGSSSYKFFEWRKCVNAVRFIGRVKRMVERSRPTIMIMTRKTTAMTANHENNKLESPERKIGDGIKKNAKTTDDNVRQLVLWDWMVLVAKKKSWPCNG